MREKAKRAHNAPEPVRQVFSFANGEGEEARALRQEFWALSALNRADPIAADDVATLVVIDGEADPDGWCRRSIDDLADCDGEEVAVRLASVQRCLADGRLEAQGPHVVRLVNPLRLSSAGHRFVYRRMVGLRD